VLALVTVAPLLDYPGAVPTEPVGRALVTELLRRNVATRVLAEPSTGDWPGEVELVPGCITRWDETPDVFDGVGTVFLAGADPATVHGALDLARSRGVAKVVTLSSHGPDIEITLPPEYWHWLAVEVVVERSGMAWSHVVPSAVMAATLTGVYPLAGESWVSRIAQRLPIRVPYADAKVPLIHESDLAEVVAQVLLDDGFDGRRVQVAGRPVSAVERVRALRDATGLPIALDEVSAEEAPAVLGSMGLTDHDIDHLLATLRWFSEHDDDTYRVTEGMLGRPLRDFTTWAREHAAAFVIG
jgi:uncharacterized protein YbjT (DUF2867 family)